MVSERQVKRRSKAIGNTRLDITLENYVKEIPARYAMVDTMYEGISRTDEKQVWAMDWLPHGIP
jgi:hypothetical protein